MNYTTRFREYIGNNGRRLEKLRKMKQFTFNELYRNRAIEKRRLFIKAILKYMQFRKQENLIRMNLRQIMVYDFLFQLMSYAVGNFVLIKICKQSINEKKFN